MGYIIGISTDSNVFKERMKSMMKHKLTKIILLSIVIVACSFASAYAATNLEPIKAFFNKSVTFVLNGDHWQPKNPQGKTLNAILYEGSNYLPVRAIAEALGVAVDYDAATQTIYIGNKPGEKKPIFSMSMEVDNIYVIQSKDKNDTLIKGKQFNEVLKIDQYGDVYFTLDRKYKRLVLDAAVIEPGEHEVVFSLYNVGSAAGNLSEILLEKHTISPDDGVEQMVFNVEGLEKIKIHVQSPNLNPYIYARIVDTSYFDNGETR